MKRASEAKAEAKRIRDELADELKKKDRAKLATIRKDITRWKAQRKAGVARAREQCQSARVAHRERAKELRAELTAAIRAERAALRGTCSVGRDAARAEAQKRIEAARRELGEERSSQRTRRLYERPAKLHAGSKATGGRRSAELRSESDDEVRNNLPPELQPVFDSVRRSIAASPRRTRTEAFFEWAAEHPERVWAITERAIAGDLKRLEADEREHHRRMQSSRRYKRKAHELEHDLADVPF